jgi:hypothetical protein
MNQAPSSWTSVASMKFIAGEPMKPATKRLAGCPYTESGAPVCCRAPLCMMKIRSAMVIAST